MNPEGRASFGVKGTKEAHAHVSSQLLMSCNGAALTDSGGLPGAGLPVDVAWSLEGVIP